MSTPFDSLRGPNRRKIFIATGLIGCVLGAIPAARAGNDTWSGGGQDRNWTTPANWVGGVAPVAGDSLLFVGTTHTATTNTFPLDTPFDNITFNSPAGFFTLAGSEVALTGNITNNQVVTPQTIALPLVLSVTPIVDVTPNGVLTLNGVLSGSGGLTTVDGGRVNLGGVNTFTGSVTADAGTVGISSDSNLGAAPGSATPGSIVLNGGTLEATTNLTINFNRGIALGPTSGSGVGTISVNDHSLTPNPNTVLSYGGILANNGGTGGLSKLGFGNLTLFGANTYTGTTSNEVGTLTLDFTQAGASANNIISSSSSLVLGGANAGAGQISYAQLTIKGAASVVNSQSFNGTRVTIGNQIIQVTNNTGGTMNVNLGALNHDAGGVLTIIPHAGGNLATTSANVNGTLGGWAVFSDGTNRANFYTATNWASVDTNTGNIVNYTNWAFYNNAALLMTNVMGAASNVYVPPTVNTSFNVDANGANSTDDVNSIIFDNLTNGIACIVGTGNTVRLGQFGGLMNKSILAGNNWHFGGDGTAGSQTSEISYLTAGGPGNNSPGEIILIDDTTGSSSTQNWDIDSVITDNGSGPVAVIKAASGYVKFRNHNTYSGGTYLLGGRLQLAGSDIGTANPDGVGTGPVFIFPGAYLFGTVPNTPVIFIAGIGTSQEPDGAIRLNPGNLMTNTIVLIGDAGIGGGGFSSPAILSNTISGPFNMYLGAEGNVGSTLNGLQLSGVCNWSGNTYIVSRLGGTSGNTRIVLGENNALPTGFGKGDLYIGISSITTGIQEFDLNGFNQTINGLFSGGTTAATLANNLVLNGASGTTSTLTIGNNDVSGTFGGIIEDTGGQMALTKIGGGVETLNGANTYSGSTTVNGGTLALSDPGSISTSTNIAVNTGATLDVTGLSAGFSTINPLQLTGGTMAGNGSVGPLTMNNGALMLDLNPATTNVTAISLALGGSSNVVNIDSVAGVASYPTAFPIIKYSGALSGGLNFVFGSVPNASTGGFFSNDVANSRIVLVLTNGPAPLTWVGGDPTNPTFWDFTTINWLKFKGTANQANSAFESQDPVIFDDTGDTNQVNVITNLQPGFITASNNVLNYTFTGTGSLGGVASLAKFGTGTLTFLNTGGDSYNHGVVVNSGTVIFGANNAIAGGVGISNAATVQVGVNAGAGTLPGGNVDDEGSLIFDAGTNLTVPNNMVGAGTITKEDSSVLTLSGNNGTLAAPINVTSGTLRAGSGNALGTGVTTINSGTTLDVNGQGLNQTAAVTVSGTGVGGLGAIINSGAASQNALGSVTLAGNTTFGGTNRWDIRGTNGLAQLSTSGNAYSITKTGPGFVGIVNLTVDAALGNIDIQQGTLDYEANSTGLGNPSSTLTVESTGATLELFNSANALNKNIVLNGSGTNDTLLCGNNINNSISGPVTVNGRCWFDAASGTALTFNNNITGSGSVAKIGTGTNIIGAGITASYTGNTTISNGTLALDGTLSSSPVLVLAGGTLAGYGTGGTVTNSGGVISPGDINGAPQSTLTLGNLTLNTNSTEVFELSVATNSGNDLLAAANLTLNGTNTLQIVPLSFMNIGDVYTLITYTGATLPSSATNQFKILPPSSFFSFAMVDPSTTPGLIQIKVLKAVGNDIWTGAISTNWDIVTTNWTRNGNPANFNDGDFVTFDDTSTVTNVNIVGARTNSNISELSGGEAYKFLGTGTLNGSAGLDFEGASLTIANAGSNGFTGLINITGGTLQVGNGGTNGTLGSGVITNNGQLVFDRSDTNLLVPNVIHGSGSLTNIGTGMVTLSGASLFSGQVTILQGTLRVLNSGALGGALAGGTVISNGATLDITNSVNLGRNQIVAGGAGVGGNGAIINSGGNSGFVTTNFSQLTLYTNIVISSAGRLDFRAAGATTQDANLSTGGLPFTLTKVGSNLLQMAGVQIDGALGDIIVNAGTLGFQWQIPSLGNPTNNLVVSNGASVAFFQMSNGVTKNLILSNNASVLAQSGIANEFDGPVTLNGTDNLNSTADALMVFANEFSGPGSLLKTGTNTIILSLAQTNGGAEIYSGNTFVNQGTLSLIDNANLTNSPTISLSNNAILSVTGRVDGTLTVGAAMPQILNGGGIVNGILVENAGSTVNPGNIKTTAVLVVSNATTLNGSVLMDLNIGAAAITNDEIIAPSISVSGPLTVTNIGPDLQTGDHFQLFNVAVSGFNSVTLPANNGTPNKTYQWRNDLGVNGSITLTNVIVISPTTSASITHVFLSGTNLVLQGTNNNVPNTNFHYQVLSSTNLKTPLANWTPLATNSFNPDGTFDYTNPVIPGKPQQFLDTKAVP